MHHRAFSRGTAHRPAHRGPLRRRFRQGAINVSPVGASIAARASREILRGYAGRLPAFHGLCRSFRPRESSLCRDVLHSRCQSSRSRCGHRTRRLDATVWLSVAFESELCSNSRQSSAAGAWCRSRYRSRYRSAVPECGPRAGHCMSAVSSDPRGGQYGDFCTSIRFWTKRRSVRRAPVERS
jgi:hypothetical protein